MSDLKMTPDRKSTAVTMLRELPNIAAVCKFIDVNRTTFNRAMEQDPDFKEAVKDAIEEGFDLVEEEVRRRAVDGVLEPVFYRGEKIGDVRKYSDTLLIFLLKGNRPKKYNPGVNVNFGDKEKVSMTFKLSGD